MSLKVKNFFATSTGTATDDLVIPSGKTLVIQAIDFSGAFSSSNHKVEVVGGSILAAANGDKFVGPLPTNFIEGPATIRCTLQKIGGGPAILMGIVIYYEELG